MTETVETDFSQFWRLEVQDESASLFGSWWEPASWIVDGQLLAGSSLELSSLCAHGEISLFLFLLVNNLIVRVSPTWANVNPICLPKIPAPNSITPEVRVSTH